MNGNENKTNKTWIEIDTDALLHNLETIKKQLNKETAVMAVVKSNAYGHGMVPVAQTITDKVEYFAVDDIDEALDLRTAGIKNPILVFGYIPFARVAEAAEYDIDITLSHASLLDFLEQENIEIGVHVLADTGLGRQGFLLGEVDQVAARLKAAPHIHIRGVYSHFASIENRDEVDFSRAQIEEFKTWHAKMKELHVDVLAHATASGGVFYDHEFEFDMVRTGIALYGLWGSEELKLSSGADLQPVLSWKAVIAETKTIPAGFTVGYDRTFQAPQEMEIAVVPVGYWHGYDRSLGNKAHVAIGGQRCPVLGTVSMNMIVIDVTDVAVRVGDEVELLGPIITADELARHAGTINYEIVTRINI